LGVGGNISPGFRVTTRILQLILRPSNTLRRYYSNYELITTQLERTTGQVSNGPPNKHLRQTCLLFGSQNRYIIPFRKSLQLNSKTVKATDFKFDTRVSRVSPVHEIYG